MRWDELFADLEAQADRMAAADRAVEVEELVRAEVGRIRLVDRLIPAIDTVLTVQCRGGLRTVGAARRVGPDWLLLDEGGGREAMVALAAVLTIGGLGRLSSPDASGPVESRLGLRSALRAVARDRSPVRLHLVDGTVLDGTVDRVGLDFLELARHDAGEPRRRGEVRDVQTVPHSAVSLLRRDR